MDVKTATQGAPQAASDYGQVDPQMVIYASLLDRLERLTEVIERISEQMQATGVCSPFISAEDAATLLGIKITDGGYHKRKLKEYCDKGLLVKFKLGRPIMYDRIEVQELAQKILSGTVNYLR